jgi:eukaryotic-like serine/threonine-protein kinase
LRNHFAPEASGARLVPFLPSIPGYELLRELGRGGMGVVFEARQCALGRVVTVKTLPSHFTSPEELTRFRREIESVARLDHPNIVPIYEVGEWPAEPTDRRPYFSMKFYPGGSLARRFGAPGTDPRADARLVETIARAVYHAHQRGILHRDLKPSNILLDESGHPTSPTSAWRSRSTRPRARPSPPRSSARPVTSLRSRPAATRR